MEPLMLTRSLKSISPIHPTRAKLTASKWCSKTDQKKLQRPRTGGRIGDLEPLDAADCIEWCAVGYLKHPLTFASGYSLRTFAASLADFTRDGPLFQVPQERSNRNAADTRIEGSVNHVRNGVRDGYLSCRRSNLHTANGSD